MNRQEAIDRLKNEVKRIEENMENGDYGCVDMDTWNEFAKKAEWRETLIELLSGPTPDPITGLVPCGCGGKAVEVGCKNASEWTYECNACGVKTKSQPNNAWAKQDWNTAMGWKGGAE